MDNVENLLSVSDGDPWYDFIAESDPSDGYNDSVPVVFDRDSLRGALLDEEINALPVYIVEPEEVYALSSAPQGAGYQISDYWINVFNGILDKYFFVDYYAFATRVQVSQYNYVNHYWLYIGDVQNGGLFDVYDCYSIDGIYYLDKTSEQHSAFDVDSNVLVYSNLGSCPDLRKGGSIHAEKITTFSLVLLVCLGVVRGCFHWYSHHFKC